MRYYKLILYAVEIYISDPNSLYCQYVTIDDILFINGIKQICISKILVDVHTSVYVSKDYAECMLKYNWNRGCSF
jgi:hypothetical protein